MPRSGPRQIYKYSKAFKLIALGCRAPVRTQSSADFPSTHRSTIRRGASSNSQPGYRLRAWRPVGADSTELCWSVRSNAMDARLAIRGASANGEFFYHGDILLPAHRRRERTRRPQNPLFRHQSFGGHVVGEHEVHSTRLPAARLCRRVHRQRPQPCVHRDRRTLGTRGVALAIDAVCLALPAAAVAPLLNAVRVCRAVSAMAWLTVLVAVLIL